jgi:flagellar hook protein FlgE
MSLFASLTTAVSGMNAQSRAMGNISENLSNSQTTGYKRVDTRFSHLVVSSNAKVNTPGGVIATPEYRNSVQGNLLATQSATDVAITGQGFFAVADSPTATTTSYSRRGDFVLDKDGRIVNGVGQFLRGWSITNPADESDFVADTSNANPLQIVKSPVPAAQTENVTYLANLPSNVISTVANPVTLNSTIEVIDQLGNINNLTLRWEKDPVNADAWDLHVGLTDENGTRTNLIGDAFQSTSVTASPLSQARVLFSNGNTTAYPGYPAGTVVGYTTNGTLPTLSASPIGTAVTLSLTDPVVTANGPFGTGTNPLTLNLGGLGLTSGMTQYSDSGKQLSVQTLDKDGYASGEFRDLRIDEDGYIIADYSNGEKRRLFQVPLAKFAAPDQLQRLDGGAYGVTQESGLPILSTPGRSGLGSLTSNSLEGSNVDIADEFSKMIVTQRVFSASARSFTTSDQMLEEIVNLKR